MVAIFDEKHRVCHWIAFRLVALLFATTDRGSTTLSAVPLSLPELGEG